MSCAAGYPNTPCPFKHEFAGRVTRIACGPCKNFIPPAHIIAWCKLWDRDRILCLKPKSACTGCPEKEQRGEGRPKSVDWTDPATRKAYYKEWRAKQTDTPESEKRFKAKHPHYWRDYMRRKRARGKQSTE